MQLLLDRHLSLGHVLDDLNTQKGSNLLQKTAFIVLVINDLLRLIFLNLILFEHLDYLSLLSFNEILSVLLSFPKFIADRQRAENVLFRTD